MITSTLLWLRANALLVKLGAGLAFLVALVGWHAHTVHLAHKAGAQQESTRRDAIDARNTLAANRALLALNERVRAAQAALAIAQLDLQKLQQENENEKAISTKLQLDLLAGRERMSILTRQRPADTAGQAPGAGVAGVDQGIAVTADIDGRVASDLEWARQTRDSAIKALAACIIEYDAVKTAADAMP